MKSGLLLDVIVRKSTPILELLAGENQSLLVWGNPFLVLDLRLHIINSIGRLDFKSDRLASQTVPNNKSVFLARILMTHVFTKICIPPRRRSTR